MAVAWPFLLLSCCCCVALRLPKVMTSNMVLPAERPVIFGWASKLGARVTATASDGESVTTTASGSGNRFQVELKPRPASMETFSVKLEEGGTSVALSNLLAGDVWVCSGQSNMEFSVAEMFGADDVIRSAKHQGLRLFAVQKNASDGEEFEDLVDTQYREGWVEASPSTACGSEYGNDTDFCLPHCGPSAAVKSFERDTWGYFSAVCFVHGVEVLKATGRPQGMLATSWGGTTIRQWQSEVAQAQCPLGRAFKQKLWGSMVAPLLPIPVRGVIWYQGESDALSIPEANLYECQLKALIEDWRARFATHPTGNLTFTTVQVSAAGDHSGGALRLSQLASTDLNGTGVAVTTDLYDRTSPCGSVHIRNKTAVGRRAARVSLALAYGQTEKPWSGPLPSTIVKKANEIHVAFTAVSGSLTFEAVPNQTKASALQGFQATSAADPTSGWISIPAKVELGISPQVVLNTTRVGEVTWMRYSWGFVPAGEFLYDDGGRAGLPAGPFLAECDGSSCTLVKGGQVPSPTPPAPPAPTANCSFLNSTTYEDDVYKTSTVPVNDFAACCQLCCSDPKCAVAQMHHGTGTAAVDLCELMATAKQPRKNVVSPPSLELACVPERSSLSFVI